MLRFCLVLIKLLLFSVEINCQCNNENPCGNIRGGQQLRMPQTLQSANGRLDVTLSVEMAEITYDWLRIRRRTYNGSIIGPTLRINPGDNVTVNLKNNLEEKENEVIPEINNLRFPNITNLHTHGLHISSVEPQDDVFVEVHPGRSYLYQYNIEPDNPAGTYWYHAHMHGSTMFQVESGLAGLLIVEDPTIGILAPPKHLADISCPAHCEHEVTLLYQPILLYADPDFRNPDLSLRRGFAQLQQDIKDDSKFRNLENITQGGTLEDWLTNPDNGVDYFVTNGQLFPVYTMPTGQRKRFRMVNAGGSKTLEVRITDVGRTTPTAACEVWEIALDGLYLDVARKSRLGKSFLVPAGRVDWIVACRTPGTYELRSVIDPLDSCSIGDMERHSGLLMTISVTGTNRPLTPQETMLPRRPSYVGDFRFLPESQVAGHFVIEANSKQHLNREKFQDRSHYRFKATVGTVQQWYLVNTDPTFGHPMHIHVNHFQIISYNDYSGPVSVTNADDNSAIVFYSEDGEICSQQSASFQKGNTGSFLGLTDADISDGCVPGERVDHKQYSLQGGPGTLAYAEPGEFRDVVQVPPLSNITIRFLAHKFADEVVIHCHILYHEDIGMMMTVKIVNENEDLNANLLSGGAEPGKCSGGEASQSRVDVVIFFTLVFVSSFTSLIFA